MDVFGLRIGIAVRRYDRTFDRLADGPDAQ